MSSMFCAISFIKDVTTANKFTAGTAVYRAADDEFIEYKFKAFCSEHTPLIEEIWKKNIALIVGRFALENNQYIFFVFPPIYQVTFNQYVPLNISSLGDEPTIYDLPIAPAFGFFTAPIQDPAITENEQGIFCLKKDVYNPYQSFVNTRFTPATLTLQMQLLAALFFLLVENLYPLLNQHLSYVKPLNGIILPLLTRIHLRLTITPQSIPTINVKDTKIKEPPVKIVQTIILLIIPQKTVDSIICALL